MTPLRAARALALGLLLGLLLTQLGVTLMRVDGRSMEPTLVPGEVLVVLRPPLVALLERFGGDADPTAEPRRGAVVVLPDPRAGGGPWGLGVPLIVKRVVALPGERIAMAGGVLSLDGEPLPEPWLDEGHRGTDRFTERVVPPREVFLLGDNRLPLASSDSRGFGPQPIARLRGRVVGALRLPWSAGQGWRSPLTALR